MWWWIIGIIVGILIIGGIGNGADEENWHTIKRGECEYVLFGGTCVIIIQEHKETKELRAFEVRSNHRKAIDVEYALGLIE